MLYNETVFSSTSNLNEEEPCIDNFIQSLNRRKMVINTIKSGVERNEIAFPSDISKTMAEHYMSLGPNKSHQDGDKISTPCDNSSGDKNDHGAYSSKEETNLHTEEIKLKKTVQSPSDDCAGEAIEVCTSAHGNEENEIEASVTSGTQRKNFKDTEVNQEKGISNTQETESNESEKAELEENEDTRINDNQSIQATQTQDTQINENQDIKKTQMEDNQINESQDMRIIDSQDTCESQGTLENQESHTQTEQTGSIDKMGHTICETGDERKETEGNITEGNETSASETKQIEIETKKGLGQSVDKTSGNDTFIRLVHSPELYH